MFYAFFSLLLFLLLSSSPSPAANAVQLKLRTVVLDAQPILMLSSTEIICHLCERN